MDQSQRNLRFYDWAAGFYDQLYDEIDVEELVRQWRILVTRVVPLFARVTPVNRPRLLELGCGTGRFLAPWAAAGFDVTGVDASSAMLARARRRPEVRRLKSSVRIVRADVREPNVRLRRGGPFDLAVGHFNFLNLFDLSDIAILLASVAGNMRPRAYFITDCAPRALMPPSSRELVRLSPGDWVDIRTKTHHALGIVDRHYCYGGRRSSERYWCHTTTALREVAKEAGWRLEATYAWRPEDEDTPWVSAAQHRNDHRVCMFRLRSRRRETHINIKYKTVQKARQER